MQGTELVSFIASIASLILAIGAIWLSIVFFRMSNEASKATTEAAKGIEASVQRLENLFDKLYSDTFSMMKDTVTDMRKHIWNKPGSIDTETFNNSIKEEIESQVSKVLAESGVNDTPKIREISEKLEMVLEQSYSKKNKHKNEIQKHKVLSAIIDLQPIPAIKLSKILDIDETKLAVDYLFPLREEGAIIWNSSPNSLSSDSVLRIASNENNELKAG